MNPDQIYQFLTNSPFALVLLIWTIFWKGRALWTAANKKQLPWFVIILTINTLGLLEILYLFYLQKYDLDKGKTLKFIEQKFGKKK